MRWTSRQKEVDISLPDQISQGTWTAFLLGQETWQLCWEPLLRTLFVRKSPDAPEIPLKYRSVTSKRFPGDMFAELILEYVGGPQPLTQQLRQELAIYVPGQEGRSQGASAKGEQVRSPMVGKVLRITVAQGQQVERGQELLVIEAMKMENKIYARNAGIVAETLVQALDQVAVGQLLVRLSPPS